VAEKRQSSWPKRLARESIAGLTTSLALTGPLRYAPPIMKLYSAFATVGGLTMASRVLGFVRDILIAAALGTGAVADAFFVAFRFPNLFRRLFGEGAFNSAFVPLFAKRLESSGPGAAAAFAEIALSCLLFSLLLVSALAMIAMPWLMFLLAPGFAEDPGKYDLAVLLTQIAFPYLTCMSLVALLSGVLNSTGRFMMAAATPILLNIVLIAAILLAIALGHNRQPAAGVILALAVTVAGLAQLLALWLAVRRAGFTLSVRRPGFTEDMRRLARLGIPGVVSGGITQINILVGTIIASLQAGAVSYLYYADRLYQLPLGIVGVAIGVVLLPDLSRKLHAGERAAVLDSQNRAMEVGLMLTLPAAAALYVAAEPIIAVLFQHGAFTTTDSVATASALMAYAAGLPAFVLIKVLQPAFFAREDTATPMRFAAVSVAVNAVGSIALFTVFEAIGLMPHVGIAVATSLAGWVNTALLWGVLVRNGDFVADHRLKHALSVTVLASVAMGIALAIATRVLEPYLASDQLLFVRAVSLAVLVAFGIALFGSIIMASGVVRANQLGRLFRRPSPEERN
jgi:putative peptidoglycan lipid II flippase